MHTPHLNAFNAPIRGLFLVALLNGLLWSALHASENQPSDIRWMTSGVETAITEATRTNKPVFIYWGADWCPPCARLKATLFRDPQFINKSRQFVMLYLDGDSINAQQEAERLNVTGYPTLVLLDQHGQERMR
ncbi:MAG: thioredoxin family protein, partial [bacterium]